MPGRTHRTSDGSGTSAPLTRRRLLAWGAALVPASLAGVRWARAQAVSEAPIAPREATEDVGHRFWRDLFDAFPLEPGERHFDNAEVGIPPLQTLRRMTTVARDVTSHAEAPAAAHVEAARASAARFWGADVGEIAIASNATDAMRRVADTLPLPLGAVVAISDAEPASSVQPWQVLERLGRVRIKRFSIHGADGKRDGNPRKWLDDAAALVVSHVLPSTGEIMPLEAVCDEAKRRNLWVVGNGSHATGMVDLDLHDLGIDAYVASGSGWMLGPRGTALLYLREGRLPELLARHRPLPPDAGDNRDAGARGIESARELELEPPSAALAAGLGASIDWLNGIGVETVRNHAARLARRIHDGLESVDGIDLLSSADAIARCPIVTLRVRRRPSGQVAEWLLDNLNMRVHRIDAQGLNAVRASIHVVNGPDDVDWFVEAVRTLA